MHGQRDFCGQLQQVQSPEQILALAASHGIAVSIQDLMA